MQINQVSILALVRYCVLVKLSFILTQLDLNDRFECEHDVPVDV